MLRPYECYSLDGNNLCRRFRNDLGLLLQLEREKRKMTQEELSHTLRIHLRIIKKMEQGLCKVEWAALCRMLKFYDKLIEVRLTPMYHPKDFD